MKSDSSFFFWTTIIVLSIGLSLLFFKKELLNFLPVDEDRRFIGLSIKETLQQIKSCKREQNYACMVAGYAHLYANDPTSYRWKANYAFSLTRSQKYSEAAPIYSELTDSSNVTYDVYAFAADNSSALGNQSAAINYYEDALAVQPKLVDVTKKLTQHYSDVNNPSAAWSLIHSFAAKGAKYESRVRGTIRYLENKFTDFRNDATSQVFKSVDHGQFFLPVKISDQIPVKSFQFDTGASLVLMDTETFNFISPENIANTGKGVATIADGSQIEIEYATLRTLSVAGWVLENINVGHCATCSKLLGMSAIEKFDASYRSKGNLHSLTLILK